MLGRLEYKASLFYYFDWSEKDVGVINTSWIFQQINSLLFCYRYQM